jgi:hypothetical protein
MTPKEYKHARRRLIKKGFVTQVGLRDGKPVYGFDPVDPAIEVLAALVETAPYDFGFGPRAWVAKVVRQCANLQAMPETTMLGFLAAALLQRGCDSAFYSAWHASVAASERFHVAMLERSVDALRSVMTKPLSTFALAKISVNDIEQITAFLQELAKQLAERRRAACSI